MKLKADYFSLNIKHADLLNELPEYGGGYPVWLFGG